MLNSYITVLMSVYNGERFLKEAIDSILGQSLSNFKFIIINDGSTDSTMEILESYQDSRIQIIHQENIGLAASLNKGLKMADTEFVARMDADDIALPERLEVQLKEFERLGSPDVLGGQVNYIGEDGHLLGRQRYPLLHEHIVKNLEKGGGKSLVHPAVMYKKSSVLNCGGYDPLFEKCCQDYDLWLRMSTKYRFMNTPKVLMKIRVTKSSIQSQFSQEVNPSRDSSSWLVCVAQQKYLFQKEGAGRLWADDNIRGIIIEKLWSSYCKNKCHMPYMVNRRLALIRADIKNPRYFIKGIKMLILLLFSHPFHTIRYVLTREHTLPVFLKRKDLELITGKIK